MNIVLARESQAAQRHDMQSVYLFGWRSWIRGFVILLQKNEVFQFVMFLAKGSPKGNEKY